MAKRTGSKATAEKADMCRIAGVSMHSVAKDLKGNVAKAREHLARGAEAGAKLVLLPELCLSGMSKDAYKVAFTADDDILHDMAATAKSLGIAASVGFFERDGRKRYVSQAFLHKGKIACVSRKIFCCETGGSDGEEFHVVDWDGALVGTQICWDLHFPLIHRQWMMFEEGRTGLIEHLPGRENPNPIPSAK